MTKLATDPAEPATDENAPFLRRIAVYTSGLLILASLTICYFAAEILLPVCLAFILNLVLRPAFRGLRALRLPHALAALVIVITLVGVGAGTGAILSQPATEWGQKLPGALPRMKDQLQFLIHPVTVIQQTASQAEAATSEGGKPVNVAVSGTLSDRLFSSTRLLIGGIFETLLILFFFLLAGDTFQQRFIEILPRVQDKKKALAISQQIESDIAAYLRTITLMNLVVGTVTFFIMLFCGIPNPILWAAIAFLLNYVPILGPMLGVAIFLLVGMIAHESGFLVFLPAILYLMTHIAEGEAITPLLLSKRFTLNPALIILMLLLWYWIWGVAGAFLATPMLAMLKIVCDRTKKLENLGHLLEG